jgi:hypothetical protein
MSFETGSVLQLPGTELHSCVHQTTPQHPAWLRQSLAAELPANPGFA